MTGSPCAAYAIQGQTPVAVARPTTLDELATAMRLAAEAGAAIAPWGSGSRMALGYPPSRLDLVVSLERMNRVVAYDPADLTITVEAGMTHAQLAQTLAPARQMLPARPAAARPRHHRRRAGYGYRRATAWPLRRRARVDAGHARRGRRWTAPQGRRLRRQEQHWLRHDAPLYRLTRRPLRHR